MGIWKIAIYYYYRVSITDNNDKYSEWISKNPILVYHINCLHWPRSGDGKCAHYNSIITYKTWCQLCDPDILIQKWISGNKYVDHYVKEFYVVWWVDQIDPIW
jgi:hypothetical protein